LVTGVVHELEADPTIDPLVLARAKSEAGHALERVEEYELGEALLRQALDTFESNASVAGADAMNARRELAGTLVAMGRTEEGLPMMEAVLERELALWGPDAPVVARSRVRIGSALTLAGRYDEAEALLLHVEQGMRTVSAISGSDMMSVTAALGDLYLATARFAEAERRYREALEIAEADAGRPDASSLRVRSGLGRALAGQARWADAIGVLAECQARISWTTPMEARWAVGYGEALHALGRDAEAAALLDRAQPLLDGNPKRLTPERERSATLRRALTHVQADRA
jgi:tetratricopeptide (TPR) repeat protein